VPQGAARPIGRQAKQCPREGADTGERITQARTRMLSRTNEYSFSPPSLDCCQVDSDPINSTSGLASQPKVTPTLQKMPSLMREGLDWQGNKAECPNAVLSVSTHGSRPQALGCDQGEGCRAVASLFEEGASEKLHGQGVSIGSVDTRCSKAGVKRGDHLTARKPSQPQSRTRRIIPESGNPRSSNNPVP
jgi:hypothetical protein